MTKYIFLTDEDIEDIKNGKAIEVAKDYINNNTMCCRTILAHEKLYDSLKKGEIE